MLFLLIWVFLISIFEAILTFIFVCGVIYILVVCYEVVIYSASVIVVLISVQKVLLIGHSTFYVVLLFDISYMYQVGFIFLNW